MGNYVGTLDLHLNTLISSTFIYHVQLNHYNDLKICKNSCKILKTVKKKLMDALVNLQIDSVSNFNRFEHCLITYQNFVQFSTVRI